MVVTIGPRSGDAFDDLDEFVDAVAVVAGACE
jgi:hypothetical protein